jgi:hypothetical protein
MLRPDDPWFLDEAADEPGELLKALPEIRQYLAPAPPDEDLGLRSLLDQPDTGAFAHPWWRDQARRSGHRGTPRPRAA